MPAPTPKLKLTVQESAFAAAIACGVSRENAKEAGKRLIRSPAVLATIHQEVRTLLVAAAPAALAVIIHLAEHAESEKVRVECSKTILDRAGHISPRSQPLAAGEQPLHEMTVDALRGMADRLEAELAARARPVNAPDDAPSTSSTTDLIG